MSLEKRSVHVFSLYQSLHGDVSGLLGFFLAHWNHSAFCLEYCQSLRILDTNAAWKKEYLFGSNSASIASVRSLWFPLLGNLGHLCENIVAFDFYLLLLFMLVMSQADCSRDNCVSKVEDAVPSKCSDWHSGSILTLRMGKVGEDQRKFIHFHAPSPKYMWNGILFCFTLWLSGKWSLEGLFRSEMSTMKTKSFEVMVIGGMARWHSPASEGILLVSNKMHPKKSQIVGSVVGSHQCP